MPLCFAKVREGFAGEGTVVPVLAFVTPSAAIVLVDRRFVALDREALIFERWVDG